jgi:hypothetical protein
MFFGRLLKEVFQSTKNIWLNLLSDSLFAHRFVCGSVLSPDGLAAVPIPKALINAFSKVSAKRNEVTKRRKKMKMM